MEKNTFSNDIWSKLTNLSAEVASPSFKDHLFTFLDEVVDVSHYVLLTFKCSRLDEQQMPLVGGSISEYWAQTLKRKAESLFHQINTNIDPKIGKVASQELAPDQVFIFRPSGKDQAEMARIYASGDILEKAYYLHIKNDRIYQLNLFRNLDKKPYSREDIAKLELILPLVMNLILLHFKVCGVQKSTIFNEKHAVSTMKDKGLPPFNLLTNQEANACDSIAAGLTTEGTAAVMNIGVGSVKTYRNRAYKKLGIKSRSELFAMLINYQIYSS